VSKSVSFRRLALLVVLAVVGVAGSASAARAGDFRASASFIVTSAQGSNTTVEFVGHASPGGSFTGTAVGHQAPGNGNVFRHVTTWDFGRGDTLTFVVEMQYDEATGLLVGTYEVTGGTGRLAGATGIGSFIAAPVGDGTGETFLFGTLSY
jgi:hypothetical protein